MKSLRSVATASRVSMTCFQGIRPSRPPRLAGSRATPASQCSICSQRRRQRPQKLGRIPSGSSSTALYLLLPPSRSAQSDSKSPAQHDLSTLQNHDNPIIRLAYFTLDDPHTCTPDPSSSRFTGDMNPSSSQYAQLAKQAADQRDLREAWAQWKALERQRLAAQAMLAEQGGNEDEEMRALAQEEIESVENKQDTLILGSIRDGVLDASGHARGSGGASLQATGAIIELRPGIGGDESSVFVGEMTRMYQRWCGSAPLGQRWKVTMLSSTPIEPTGASSSGAFKEAILRVDGKGAYEALRYEAGIHRVQRIPETTSIAKLQSSTMTVVVLPLDSSSASQGAEQSTADDIVDPQDVRTEVMRSRGAGGQHVNKTESAIRLTHIPTGITVSMQDSRSQHQNREKAWQVLRARLLDLDVKRKEQEARDVRGEQIVGLGRGDRVRTYNFPQDRVTEHRLGQNVGSIDAFMEGEGQGLREFVQGLAEAEKSLAVQQRLRALLMRKGAALNAGNNDDADHVAGAGNKSRSGASSKANRGSN